MELDTEMDLNEVAGLLGVTGEKLIRLAANGKLAITVLADDWPIRTEDGAVGSITGPANLVPKDLACIIHEQIKEIKQKPRMCENDV